MANPPLPLISDQIDRLIAKRNEAREAKDFKEADRIRDEIKAMGFDLVDNKDGTTSAKVESMTPLPQTKLAMRPMLPTDVPLLAEIFRASIEELAAEDYSEAQQEAWASAADDEEEFGARLAGELTLVTTHAGSAVGFGSLANNTRIEMLYVHPAAAGQGAGSMLCDALEKLAAARGTKELSVDASDTARGFFERRGFVAKTRNTVVLAGEWLANTTMVKPLTAVAAKGTLQ